MCNTHALNLVTNMKKEKQKKLKRHVIVIDVICRREKLQALLYKLTDELKMN